MGKIATIEDELAAAAVPPDPAEAIGDDEGSSWGHRRENLGHRARAGPGRAGGRAGSKATRGAAG